jgi:eukaryotic-like serine/threonine-protein kinase
MTSREALRRAEARVGTILRGKYRIDRVLGAGGMAVVYEVTHRNQKRFALKMLHVQLSLDEDVRRRFLREGYLANTVDHPGAVVVIDDDTAEDGAAFLVMELLDGRQLDELLVKADRRLPAEAVLSAAEQTLDVLVPAHTKGIVHRDIKPANLFILRDGTLKVLDFGIARLHDLASSQATGTGVMLGTPAYMPPEQALSQASQIDARTDVWSVGATMFTLLSGANVHVGQTATQILVAAATQNPRHVRSVAPWVDERVDALIAKALAFKKSDRWESAAEMKEAIRKVHEEIFGGLPSRAALAALIDPEGWKPANPAPFIASETPPQDRQTTPAGRGTDAESGSGASSSRRDTKAVEVSATNVANVDSPLSSQQSSVAFSTAKPVSNGSMPPPPRIGGAVGRGIPWIASALVVAAAGALLFGLRGSKPATATAPLSPATSEPAPTPPPAIATAAPSATATEAITTATATPTATLSPTTRSSTVTKRVPAAPPPSVAAAPSAPAPRPPPAAAADAGDLVLQRK